MSRARVPTLLSAICLAAWACGPLPQPDEADIDVDAAAACEAEEPLTFRGCERGVTGGQITFVPNVQSFLDYSAARGLGWTEAQIRRELTAAAEEWNHRSEANLRVRVSDGASNALAVDTQDDVSTISLCDPEHSNVTGCQPAIAHSGGGLANFRCADQHIPSCDIQFFHRGAYAGTGNVPNWRLQHQVSTPSQASRSLFRTAIHEMGHCLGMAHYNGVDWPSVMNAGGSWWGNDLNKFAIQTYDIREAVRIYGGRTAPVLFRSASTASNPPQWQDGVGSYGTAAAGVGALQVGNADAVDALIARNSDGSRASDQGRNSLTVYRRQGRAWSYKTVTSVAGNNVEVRGAPSLAKSGANYVAAFHDHNKRIRVARTVNGSLESWATVETGFVTSHAIGLARVRAANRLFMIYNNDAHPSDHVTWLHFVGSDDNGATWDPLIRTDIRAFGGVAFTCLNDGSATAWPCTVAYQRWSDFRAVVRKVRPNPANRLELTFGPEELAGVFNDYSSVAPSVTTGPAPGGAMSVLAYDRNGDQPLPDYAARTLTASGAYDARTFAVNDQRNVWSGSTFPLNSTPAVGLYPSSASVVMFYTRY